MGNLSREYLEEALAAAKRLLPGWQYAVIRQSAFPRSGARARHAPAEKPAPTRIQSLIFDREQFNPERAKAWAEEHGYSSAGIEETENSLRLRQEDPGTFDTMRTIDITEGIKAVIGIKGDTFAAKEQVAKGDGMIVGLWIDPATAESIALAGGEVPEDLHITLAHLGDPSLLKPWAHEVAARALLQALSTQPPLTGQVSGVGRFETPSGDSVLYASPDVPGLSDLRERIVSSLKAAGLPVSDQHGFDPHITLAYLPSGVGVTLPAGEGKPPIALKFTEVVVALGPVRLRVPFGAQCPNIDAAIAHVAWVARFLEAMSKTVLMEQSMPALHAMRQALEALTGSEALAADCLAADYFGKLEALPASSFLDGEGRKYPAYTAEGLPYLPALRESVAALSGLRDPAEVEAAKPLLAQATKMLEAQRKGWSPLPWALGGPGVEAELPADAIPTFGNPGAPILFVSAAPSPIDAARGEPLTGQSGATFRNEYLGKLGVTKSDVAITHLVPLARKHGQPDEHDVAKWATWVRSEIERIQPRVVVALGTVTKAALGDRAQFYLPHPAALKQGDTRGEIARKLKSIRRMLTSVDGGVTDQGIVAKAAPSHGSVGNESSPTDPTGVEEASQRKVAVAKADRIKRIVYGVVLDPYTVDTQNDWASPSVIEETAHQWLAKSRVIGMNHGGRARAFPVESFMVPYPSPQDHEKAMRNEPHRAVKIKLGNQEVGSGAWVLGVKVEDDGTWAKVEDGRLDAFSIGGFTARTNVPKSAMPKVSFVNAK